VLRVLFFFSSRRRHTRSDRDWSSDVCSSDLAPLDAAALAAPLAGALPDGKSGLADPALRAPTRPEPAVVLLQAAAASTAARTAKIGRAPCRERAQSPAGAVAVSDGGGRLRAE